MIIHTASVEVHCHKIRLTSNLDNQVNENDILAEVKPTMLQVKSRSNGKSPCVQAHITLVQAHTDCTHIQCIRRMCN